MASFACPNQPPCPHPGLVHDIEDYSDPKPMCCADGCPCGKPDEPSGEVRAAVRVGVRRCLGLAAYEDGVPDRMLLDRSGYDRLIEAMTFLVGDLARQQQAEAAE